MKSYNLGTIFAYFIHFAHPIVKFLTKFARKNNDKARKIAGNNWKIEFLHKYSRKNLKKHLTYLQKGGIMVLWKSVDYFLARLVSYD